MPQAAEARRGVSAMVRWAERIIMLWDRASGEAASSWVRVQPAQPVPRITRFGLGLEEEGLFLERAEEKRFWAVDGVEVGVAGRESV